MIAKMVDGKSEASAMEAEQVIKNVAAVVVEGALRPNELYFQN